jgi:toxin ParE1/3/4
LIQIRWSPKASAEFDAIVEYVAADNETAAIRQGRLLLAATKQLERFPQSGRLGRGRNARELAVTGTPYIILYTLHSDDLNIISIRHGAMHS